MSKQETASDFNAKSTIKAADLEHRRKINFNIGRYNAVVPQGKTQFLDVEFARKAAKNSKWKAIENLDKQLELFEKNFTAIGTKNFHYCACFVFSTISIFFLSKLSRNGDCI